MEVVRAFLMDFAGNNINEEEDYLTTPPHLLGDSDSNDSEEAPPSKRTKLDETGAYLLVPLGGNKSSKPITPAPIPSRQYHSAAPVSSDFGLSVPCPIQITDPAPAPSATTTMTSSQHQQKQQQQQQVMIPTITTTKINNVATNPAPAPMAAAPVGAAPAPASTMELSNISVISQQQQQQLSMVQSGSFPLQPSGIMYPQQFIAANPSAVQQQQQQQYQVVTTYAIPTQPKLSLTTGTKSVQPLQLNAVKSGIITNNNNNMTTKMSPQSIPAPAPLAAPQQLTTPQPQQVISAPTPMVPLSLHNAATVSSRNPTTTTTTTTRNVVLDPESLRKQQKRKRNAEQAKKTRERKKQASQLLSLEFYSLQRENEHLKSLIHSQLPDQAQEIIGDACYTTRKWSGRHSAQLQGSDFELIETLTKTRQNFVITDPHQEDNPIVYASPSFLQLTGYRSAEVEGRNCRFLQGKDTDADSIQVIRDAIAQEEDATTCILNYKKDGTPFWNHFFIAPLRDNQKRVVNYVGIQTEIVAPDQIKNEAVCSSATANSSKTKTGEDIPTVPPHHTMSLTERLKALEEIRKEKIIATPSNQQPQQPTNEDYNDMDMVHDWADLAETLDVEFPSAPDFEINLDEGFDTFDALLQEANTIVPAQDALVEESLYQHFAQYPRELVQRTIRSELIGTLQNANGDTTDPHFLSALELLTKLFKHDTIEADINTSTHSVLHGDWRSIARPPYHSAGCVGQNEMGDFVYTLGKTSFTMFQPSDSRVTIQRTMCKIEPTTTSTCVAPWSLRRELAYDTNTGKDSDNNNNNSTSMLKTYDITAALTLEPPGPYQEIGCDHTTFPSPSRRLRASYKVKGYFLPDPEVPNRITVWFTGGHLTPASAPEKEVADLECGGLKEWMELFGAEHRRSWGESLGIMGAKLFLGAELPDGMETDGTMSYTLHRPYGGHGKGYVDILYADHEVLVTKGNSGTLHVMVNQNNETTTGNH
eukprot:CAMPEP_0178903604 /NCGR_PEP_ID=MMETSP0786-20121207/5245_1 /TAXON_ID=186022 /ORGANISM="Thalassionema frauenfeldii, Strain CCMP 1798" /LENGTH=984 /DNA_ID=CAMNT_0020574985 /DNA_START=87 /DNA_END=3041 /DNA_ORIENTATION=-